jgi:hypothetical protein
MGRAGDSEEAVAGVFPAGAVRRSKIGLEGIGGWDSK